MLDELPWNVLSQIACNLDNESMNSLVLTCRRTSECFKTESKLLQQIDRELMETGIFFQDASFDHLFNHNDPVETVYQLANITARIEASLFKQLGINYNSVIPEIYQTFAPSSTDSVPKLRDYARAVYRHHPVLKYFHWSAPRHSSHLSAHAERIKKMAHILLRNNTQLRARMSTEPLVNDWLVSSLMYQTFGDLPFGMRIMRLIRLKELVRIISVDTISSAARMALQESNDPDLLLHSYIMSETFPFPAITKRDTSRSLLLFVNNDSHESGSLNEERSISNNDAYVLDRVDARLVMKRQNAIQFIENWHSVLTSGPAVHADNFNVPQFDDYTSKIEDRIHNILKKPLSHANSFQYLKQCSQLLSSPVLQQIIKRNLRKFWSHSWKFVVLYLSMHFNVRGVLPAYMAVAVETTRQTMPRSLIMMMAALRIGENLLSSSMRAKYHLDRLISRALLTGIS